MLNPEKRSVAFTLAAEKWTGSHPSMNSRKDHRSLVASPDALWIWRGLMTLSLREFCVGCCGSVRYLDYFQGLVGPFYPEQELCPILGTKLSLFPVQVGLQQGFHCL